MDKSKLSERDICSLFVTPALLKVGWNPELQIREEVSFTDGRIYIQGKDVKRGQRKRADYILYHKPNIPIAIIEVKDNNHTPGSGMQQALDYAAILDIPVAFSTNGDSFIQHDRSGHSSEIEKNIPMDSFPSPADLWEKYKIYKGLSTPQEEETASYDYFFDPSGKKPRYYQQIAINRTVEAISKGQKNILLVMATGTGKTFVAFQIIYRLWKSKTKKRILFLADRKALIDQTKRNDFKHFKDKMTIIRKKIIDPAYEIYLALYQGLTNYDDEVKDAYKEFSPDFFDLVIVDECHRGSAADDSAWREILDYFSSATQIGLTATPKETSEISNIEYFGEPVYTYSLRQGIEDGFLAPYKVIRIGMNVDLEGWRPGLNKNDIFGNPVEDRIYNTKDYDRNLVIDERTRTVASRITEYLKKTNRYDKTIVFCIDIEHAERMRQALANENPDEVRKSEKYVMKITGDDDIGKRELDNFINPEETYPVIATTSKLMTTGIDAQTCKLIVLDSNIQSMTEFKQIIGRGTRINEEFGKYFFTIMDFRNVTNLFADSTFDGDPVMVKSVGEEDPIPEDDAIYDFPPDEIIDPGENIPDTIKEPPPIIVDPPSETPREKTFVNGVDVSVLNVRIQHLNSKGDLIIESLAEYTKKGILNYYKSLNDFLQKWNGAEKKKMIIDELESNEIIVKNLLEEIPKELDIFDLICHVAWDQPPLSRKERADRVKKRNYFTKYGDKVRAVLNSLLDKYADEGIENIEDLEILRVDPFTHFGTPSEIINIFGRKENYLKALKELEQEIYKGAA